MGVFYHYKQRFSLTVVHLRVTERKGHSRVPYASRRGFLRLSRVLPTSRVFTSGYVNTETILHFFYKTTNERGTKTAFTYAHVKWFYGLPEGAYVVAPDNLVHARLNLYSKKSCSVC